jgi:hypothetical protein
MLIFFFISVPLLITSKFRAKFISEDCAYKELDKAARRGSAGTWVLNRRVKTARCIDFAQCYDRSLFTHIPGFALLHRKTGAEALLTVSREP